MGRRKKASLGLKIVLATITWVIVFGLLTYFIPNIIAKYIVIVIGILILIYNIWALFVIDTQLKKDFDYGDEPWAI